MSALARFDQQAACGGCAPADYLSFLLGGELFAVNILNVKEIIEASAPTAVPMLPACVLGVINLRGTAVPVMDLSLRVGRGATGLTRRSCIVIVEMQDGRLVGVLADAVNAVLSIGADELAPAPAFGGRNDFLDGMAKLSGKFEGRFAMLLNVQQVLSADDLGTATLALATNHTTGAMS